MAENAGSIFSEVRIRLDKLKQDIVEVNALMDKADKSLTDSTSKASKTVTSNFNAMSIAAVAASAAIITAFRSMITSTAAYSRALSDVQAATRGTTADLANLEQAAAKAGDSLGTSTTDALGAVEALAKAGVSTADIIGGALPGALTLAAAGSMDVADAAEIAAATMTQFGLAGADVTHIADLLAAGAGKAQGEVSDLSMALKQSGLVAAQTGLKIEDTVGALAAFASAGLLGSDAGTSFRTMLLRLTPQSKEAADEMKRLGINAFDANGEFIGLSNYAQLLKEKLSGLTTEQRNAALATVFGSDSIRAANILYTQGAKGIDEWKNKVNDAGYAAEIARIKLDNLNGDLKKLDAATTDTANKIGESLNPVLRGATQFLTVVADLVGKIPGPVLAFGSAAVGLAAALVGLNAGLSLMGITLSALTGPIGLFVVGVSAITAGVIAAGSAMNELTLKEARTEFETLGKATGVAAAEMDTFVVNAKTAKDQLKEITEFDKNFGAKEFKEAAENAGLTTAQLAHIVLGLDNIPPHIKAVANGFKDSKLESELFLAQQQATWKAMDDYWGKKYPQEQKKAAVTTKATVKEIVDTVDEAWATQTALMEEFYKRDAELLAQSEQDELDAWATQTALMEEFYARDAQALAEQTAAESQSAEARKKNLEANIKLATDILDAFSGLTSALSEVFSSIYQSQIDDATAAYEREKELIENNGQTKQQTLENNLATAQATGDATAIADAKRALDLYNLEADFTRKKAQLEYQAALTQWRFKVALAVADSAEAIVKAATGAPWPLNIPAIVFATAIGATQTAAVMASAPKAPKFETGGIVPGSSFAGDRVPAMVNSGEMILNRDQQSALFNMINSGGSGSQNSSRPIQLIIDGRIVAQSTADWLNSGQIRLVTK